jgi:hypothetical protein
MSEESEVENKKIIFNEELVRELVYDEVLLKSFSYRYIRINKARTEILIRLIATDKIPIHAKDICGESGSEGFIKKNFKEFDKDGHLKKEERSILRLLIEKRAVELRKGIIFEDNADNKEEDSEKIISKDNKYFIHKGINYGKFNAYYEDSYVDAEFRYDFANPDLELLTKPSNGKLLQRVSINIVQDVISVSVPVEYFYRCAECGWETVRKVRSVAGTLNKIKCSNIVLRGEGEDSRTVRCNEILHPVQNAATTKNVYYTSIIFPNSTEKNGFAFSAFSFNKIECGTFEAVLYNLCNKNGSYIYHIVDTKEMPNEIFVVPEKKSDNYMKDLVSACDDYIMKRTRKKIVGMLPIKLALVIQAGITFFNTTVNHNIQIIGSQSTGKSMIMKYYGYFLYKAKFLSTMGSNISIPGMRGSKTTVTLMYGDMTGINTGYLGTKKMIHIDEVKESPDLYTDMKSFLSEPTYSFNKSTGNDAIYVKTAQVNTTSNLDIEHIGQYCGSIKKAYKEIDVKIEDLEKPVWDEEWDLFMPLYEYINNPYLYKIIKEKRYEYTKKNVFWMDGTEIAMHQRFPFYFNISKKNDEWGFFVIKQNVMEGNLIFSDIEILRALKTDGFDNYLESCREFREIPVDKQIESMNKVTEIIKSYGCSADAREVDFWNKVIEMIRMINKRKEYDDSDYELIKYIIENTNKKVFVEDMCEYNVKGPGYKDISKEDDRIYMNTRTIVSEFGLSKEDRGILDYGG